MHSVVLENYHIRVHVSPQCGGKIMQIETVQDNHHWLWENKILQHKQAEYSESYVEKLDSGGWDEIAPTVSPCTVLLNDRSVLLPDHGDLVRLPAKVIECSNISLTVQWDLKCLPLQIIRKLTLIEKKIVLEYQLQNIGNFPCPFLWAMHPLLPLLPHTKIHLKGECVKIQKTVSIGSRKLATIWDEEKQTLHIPGEGELKNSPFAWKLFTSSSSCHGIELHYPKSYGKLTHKVAMRWDSQEIPHLGLWINAGAWSGVPSAAPYFNIGIEPTNYPADYLPPHSTDSADHVILPDQKREWSVECEIQSIY